MEHTFSLHRCSPAMHLDPEVHRWGIWKTAANGKCFMNVCGLRWLCRGRWGFRYHCKENQGDQLMLSSPNCTCVPNYSSAQTKEACSKPWSEQTFKNAFTKVASSFICAWAHGRAGQRAGLDTVLQLSTLGSKVNSDFLFILKDLRPLWFPVASWCVCAVVSGFVYTELQWGFSLFHLILLFIRK